MSVEAADILADGDQATTLRTLLAATDPQLCAISASPTRVVAMTACYDGDAFVMAGGLVGGPTVTCVTGPACELPEQLGELLTALSEATSVPLSPRFGAVPVPVPDALVLAEDVRAGAADDLIDALRVAELDAVPLWLSDLAHGVSATFLVLVTDATGTRLGTHLVGLPTGWGHLDDIDGELTMRPMDYADILAELDEIGLIAASLVGET